MTGSLLILTFHAIEEGRSVISFNARAFEHGLATLHAHGYRTVSLTDVVASLQRGRPLPNRSFVITFDDGYRSVYEMALPLLQRFGMCATVFLIAGAPGSTSRDGGPPSHLGRAMLSWRAVRELHQAGIVFGAHTVSHPDLTRLPIERAAAEILESKRIIEDALGAGVDSFAYPKGRYDRRTCELVRQHFLSACSDRLGLVTGASDLYALERVDAYYLRARWAFALMATKWAPWYLSMRGVPRRIRRAIARGRVRNCSDTATPIA